MSAQNDMDGGTNGWSDDPRLLAYALGETAELGAEDVREIEAALEKDPACRAALAELEAVFPQIEELLAGRAEPASLAAAPPDAAPLAAAKRAAAPEPALAASALDDAAEETEEPEEDLSEVELAGAPVLARADRLSAAARDEIRRAAGSSRGGRPAWAGPLMAAGLLGVSGAAIWTVLSQSGGWSRFGGDAAPGGEVLLEASLDGAADAAPAARSRAPMRGSQTESRQALRGQRLGSASGSNEWRPELKIPHEDKMVYRRSARPGEESGPERSDGLRKELRELGKTLDGVQLSELGDGADELLEAGVADSLAAPSADESAQGAVADNDEEAPPEEVAEQDLAGEAAPVGLTEAEEQVATEPPPAPENPFIDASIDPFATFSTDVDTASYTMTRAALRAGRFPYPAGVRVEEFVNYFAYGDAPPATGDAPFAVHADVGAAPWAPEHRLVRIGVQAREIDLSKVGAANIVFLVDVSGSMNAPHKLPLVKKALATLTASLRPDDRVAIVVYANAQGLALRSTPVDARESILRALETLESGGSTNGGAGIQLAYSVARDHFVEGGVNRVVLCTDGDFNVGVTGEGALEDLIAEEAEGGVELTVLGFGTSRGGDSRMEALSNRGNGNYALVDSEYEARRVLTEAVGGTLVTVAKDVKIQVAWNAARVAAFRLVGYENRMLEHADFLDDTVDAGEIGSGHHVTALFEVVPRGGALPETLAAAEAAPEAEFEGSAGVLERAEPRSEPRSEPRRDPRSEPQADAPPAPYRGDGLLEVRLRHKAPGGDVSRGSAHAFDDLGGAGSDDLRFAAAVAAFAQKLRGSAEVASVDYGDVRRWALGALGDDPGGLRAGFVALVERAQELASEEDR